MAKKRDSTVSSDRRKAPQLPNAELEVLACLWQEGSATARQLREKMMSYRPMSHGSMVTLLKRLSIKGLVTREEGPVGKAFIYKPTCPPEPTYNSLVKNLLQRVFGGNGIALITSFFETHIPTPEELEKLQELLNQLRRKGAKR